MSLENTARQKTVNGSMVSMKKVEGKKRKVWCGHYWREDRYYTEFVSSDDREVSQCENPKSCPYCGWEKTEEQWKPKLLMVSRRVYMTE
jgi:hypothetical protein